MSFVCPTNNVWCMNLFTCRRFFIENEKSVWVGKKEFSPKRRTDEGLGRKLSSLEWILFCSSQFFSSFVYYLIKRNTNISSLNDFFLEYIGNRISQQLQNLPQRHVRESLHCDRKWRHNLLPVNSKSQKNVTILIRFSSRYLDSGSTDFEKV